MNLEELLEKMKEKPDTVWHKEGKLTPKECLICRKALYKRTGGSGASNLCKSCIDEMAREDAKGGERDPWEINDWTFPTEVNVMDTILEVEAKAREELHGYTGRREDILTIDNDGIVTRLYPNEPTKAQRVQEALNLLRKEFKEVNVTL